jgi:hypothetical protein
MSERESIFRVKLLQDGSLECEDWQGNTHRCTEANLGTTIRRVLASPELPPVERVSAGGYNMAEAYAKMILPEQFQGLVRPAANALLQALQHIMTASNEGRQARADAWRQQQQPPRPPEPPPRHPPRSANRRGRCVA